MRRQDFSRLLDWSVPLFRVFGVQVRLHWTFIIVLLFIVAQDIKLAPAYGITRGAAFAWGLLHVVALYVLILLHELGHTLAAMSQGLRAREILLWPLGGLARLADPLPGPKTDLFVTAAGPAVNLFIIVPTFILMIVSGNDPAGFRFFGAQLLPYLFNVNLFLAAFNIIPAFPMDGGRMLAAALSLKIRHTKAFHFAGGVGYVFGAGMIMLGLYYSDGTGGTLLFLIGLMNILNCYWLRKQLSAGAVVYAPSGSVNLDTGGLDGAAGGGWAFGGAEQPVEPEGDGYLVGPTVYQERSRRREEERRMRQRVDELLDKVRTGGTVSLTQEEKDFLNSASRRFRQRH